MAKQNDQSISEREALEAQALADLEEAEEMEEIKRAVPEDHPESRFVFKAGRPLPAGFENPPKGDEMHYCTDKAGNYRPDWVQIIIHSVYDHQQDPQVFPGAVTYAVPLETWCDCPPRIKASLESAVEIHHHRNATTKQIYLGEHPEHKKIKRRRFQWDWMPSQ